MKKIMDKKDYVKFLLPLVAVVVVIESVLLIVGLDEKRVGKVSEVELTQPAGLEGTQGEGEPALSLSFVTETRSMEVGEKYEVEVKATALYALPVDSVELYVSYDPEVLKISGLVPAEKLPEPVFSRVSEKKKVVVVTYLVTEKGGVAISSGEVVSLLKFEVEPLVKGDTELDFATGKEDGDSVTMFVESETGKVLPLTVNKLTIKVK